MRAFFAARGSSLPARHAQSRRSRSSTTGEEAVPEAPPNEDDMSTSRRLAQMSVMERMKVATRGTREERSILVRDPNRLVAAAVLSSPKLTESEVESFAKMANVSRGSAARHRHEPAVDQELRRRRRAGAQPEDAGGHLAERCCSASTTRTSEILALDRNVPEPLRIAARKRATATRT